MRRQHLIEAGRQVRIKKELPALLETLRCGLDGSRFSFRVISAAPKELVASALSGIVPSEHIFGTELDYDPWSGEVRAISRVPAGYGKVAVLDEIAHGLGVVTDRIVYVGDGSSDVHVMLHVNNGDGFTIAVSENQQLARIAQATVLSDSAFSILVPVLNQVLHLRTPEIRAILESQGLLLKDWERAARTDRVRILELPASLSEAAFA